MLETIKRFFEEQLMSSADDPATIGDQAIQTATAALLIELGRADFVDDPIERAVIVAMLRDTFDLDDALLDELLSIAETAAVEANDVFQFTQLVNEHYHYDSKIRLIENLWEVAYADGRLDKYEEQFIRKVSGLIHIAHSDFIKAKVEVLEKIETREG